MLPALALAAQGVDPHDSSLSPSERLEALIQRVEAEQSQVETLEATFRMVRESDLLLEPQESTGVLHYQAPDRVRWEYETPDPMILVIADGELTTWYEDLGEAERASIEPYSQRALQFFNASSSVASLLDYFDARLRAPEAAGSGEGLESEAWRLELTPADDRVARRIRSVTLWIDAQRYLPVQVRLEGADGAVTQYVLEEQRTNIELAEDLFLLELPAEVEVRTLELPGS
ncbi:MAG: outer membrane lipoprotein carrier protein LolA [Acidobacteriota bacterium]